MQVLAGDIGGTKTLLALADVDLSGTSAVPRIELIQTRRFESRAFPGLAGVSRAFEEELGRKLPRRAGFGVAGPVKDGRSQTTNLPWVLDEADLDCVERGWLLIPRGRQMAEQGQTAAATE